MNEQIRTFLRQAAAFLQDGRPKQAFALLDQARVLARGDSRALARVRFLQARAHEAAGDDRRTVEAARQAIGLDPSLLTELRGFVGECQRHGKAALADQLGRLLPPEPSAAGSAVRAGRRWVLPAIVALAALAVGATVIVYRDRLLTPVEAPRKLDIPRIRANVGLVVVAARYVRLDSTETNVLLSVGSCFAVSPDGLLVTCKHVTNQRFGGDEEIGLGLSLARRRDWHIWACFGSDPKDHLEARIVYESAYHDLALLRVDRLFPRHLQIADSFQQGDEVYAVGFPGKVHELLKVMDPAAYVDPSARHLETGIVDQPALGLSPEDYVPTVTRGVIGATRTIKDERWIQHDAVIAGGSSGGPLVKLACEVVGINTLGHTESEGFNLALTLDQLKLELDPFLGRR